MSNWSIITLLLLITTLFSLSFAQDGEEGETEDTGNMETFNAKISLPWSDFKQLLGKIRRDTVQNVPQQELPAQYVVSEADISGNPVNNQECIFSVQLLVNVLDAKAYIEIPLGRGFRVYLLIIFRDRQGCIRTGQRTFISMVKENTISHTGF
jgi:hypothetical protein